MAPQPKRKAKHSDEAAYVPRQPQRRAKKSALPEEAKKPKKAAVPSRRDPRAQLLEAQQALDAAIDDRKEAQQCYNQTQQRRCNMERERDLMRVLKGWESGECIAAEENLWKAEEEVAEAQEWVRETLEAEAKCGPRLNLLWETVRLLDEEEGVVKVKREDDQKDQKMAMREKKEVEFDSAVECN
ncbi:hypothetical protein CB0940_08626 [Cercospora beticola]|uniref:Uncharacterized protein n=1 Tax=Cercospora beticola TaxID=122368 RepID=A0A2G5HR92_CERBT|nr:hypothetical protein CB0940_08626 [Cercospora beticola]PIA94742.1 hypothetical protein CB0940_08626 [Cercospora beticola]WPB05205.1 hypothetical protein RHO25_009856 [Cercospora beticola]